MVSSSTLYLEHLGLEVAALKQKKGRVVETSARKKSTINLEIYKSCTHLGYSSLLTALIIALRFRAVTLGFLGWLGKSSPPGKFVSSWEVVMLDFFKKSARVRSSSVSSSSSVTGSMGGRLILCG
jgi:hypothetical protein